MGRVPSDILPKESYVLRVPRAKAENRKSTHPLIAKLVAVKITIACKYSYFYAATCKD